ncbi:hypothetical protein GCM10010435_71120 [Winogradskya consettensis]|uniref:Ricin B lectin domain-containing protein n=1 Tax=Winogradskya consettensis TaxID=113560 RepID=A0A919VVX9_9ACTN|nr:RICIN domain-containing protein [Actinoplanes consettensis]GIM71308.1 hypothetical protein Aco04nite_24630 [Actinoplanes consettensis]
MDDTEDPLLVRPYVSAPPPVVSSPTWPASPPAPDLADATVVIPRVPPAVLPRRRRRWALLIAVVVALAAAGLAVTLKPGAHRTPQAFVDVSLPPWSTAATPAGVPSSATATRTSRVRTRSPISTRPSSSRTSSASPAPSFSAAPSPAPSPSVVSAVARTGTITETGGYCLDLNGGVAVDTNHVQVFDCNGTAAQVWTLDTDGTLRVSGKCAQSSDDTRVRITTCRGQDTTLWRVDGATVINVATGTCLTDPAGGNRLGAGVRTTTCNGSSNQRWNLP